MKLTKKQTLALDYLEDKTTTELLFGGAAGGGKSLLGCYWILKNCLKYPGTRWLIGRAVLKTLKETTLKTLFEVITKQNIPVSSYRYNQLSNEIIFYNKSEIFLKDLFLYPRDPNLDELGSLELTGAFIDEASQVKEKVKNIVKSRIRFKLDEYNLIPKILYTSNPGKGWLYNDFYKPSKNGGLSESKVFIQSLLNDNPYIFEGYRDNLEQLDKESKERLLFGNWDYEAEGIVFPEFKLKRFKDVDFKNAEIAAYCDIADQGIDYLCFVVGAVIGENVFILDVVYSQLSSENTEPMVIKMYEKYNISKSIYESNNQGMMYMKSIIKDIDPKFRPCIQPLGNYKTNKHTRIIMQSDFILENFYFKNTDNKMYNLYLDHLTSYKYDKSFKIDDAPDATAGLSRFIRNVIL